MLGSGVVASCTSGSSSTPAPAPTTTATTAPGADQLSGDLSLAALAASLENLLAAAYQSALDMAGDGKLGTVPPAVTTFVTTVQSHHRDHAAAWNAILTAAGRRAVTGVDSSVNVAVVQPALASLKDVAGLVRLGRQVEEVAAATYLDAVQNTLTTTGAIQTAAAIQPVEMQHLAILNLFVATDPVPDSFATTSGSRGTGDQIG
jgi:hypothetical protein